MSAGGAVAVDLSHDLVRIPSLSLLPLSFICWLATVRYSMRLYGTPYNGSILYCTRPIVFLLLHKKGLKSHHNPPPLFPPPFTKHNYTKHYSTPSRHSIVLAFEFNGPCE